MIDRGQRHNGHDFESIIGLHGVESKCFYWAVKLLHYGTETDIIFGFVKKDIDPVNFNAPILENRSFIGLIPGSGRTISNRQPRNYVLEPCPFGTELGLLLMQAKDDKKKGSLLLFREGQFVDYIEENSIAPGVYYPVASLQNSGHEVRFTAVPNPAKLIIPSTRER